MPIVAFAPGDKATMLSIHEVLMKRGIYIQYANYRGSGGAGVLRVVVFSTHTKAMINRLAGSLKTILG